MKNVYSPYVIRSSTEDVLGEHREEHGGERRQEGDHERDRGKHLVARAAPQSEHAPAVNVARVRTARPGRSRAPS